MILSLNFHTNENSVYLQIDFFPILETAQIELLDKGTRQVQKLVTGVGGLPATQKRNVSNVLLATCIHPYNRNQLF